MDIIICPDHNCGAPAEIIDRWTFASTDGPLLHLKTRCLRGHCLTPRLDHVVISEASGALRDAAA
jgi:hypothetical protein